MCIHLLLQVEQLMEQGTRTRTTAATHMNANSSRSHMLIILQLKQVSGSVFPKNIIHNKIDIGLSQYLRSLYLLKLLVSYPYTVCYLPAHLLESIHYMCHNIILRCIKTCI